MKTFVLSFRDSSGVMTEKFVNISEGELSNIIRLLDNHGNYDFQSRDLACKLNVILDESKKR